MNNNAMFRASKKEVLAFFPLILFLGICYCSRNHMLINWLGIVLYLFFIFTWRWRTGEPLFSTYAIFITFFVMFNYGQPLMWAFNIHSDTEIGKNIMFYGTGYIPSEDELIDAQLYVCFAMLSFHLGAMLLARKRTHSPQYAEAEPFQNDEFTQSMRVVSRVLLFIIAPVSIYSAVRNMYIARIYGYRALYYGDLATQSGYAQILMFLFFPLLVAYLIGNNYSKKAQRIAYSIFSLYAIPQMLSGDRGSWIYSLVILIYIQTYYQKIPARRYLEYTLFAVIGVYFLNVITAVRDNGVGLSSLDFSSAFKVENSPIIAAFFELGGTMSIITFLLHTGNGIFPYANTYLIAALGVVSSRLLKVFNLKQIFLADWFSQGYLGINWGAGFSMIGEAYINGGLLGGLVYMMVLGMCLGKILQYSSSKKGSVKSLNLFVSTAGLNAVIGFSRGALYLTLKELFYGTIILVLCFKFYRRYSIRRDNG